MFLLFVGYGVWCVILRGMPNAQIRSWWWNAPSDFLWLYDEDDVELLNGGRVCLVGRGDKYLTMIKTKHLGLLDSDSYQFHCVIWKL